MAKEPVEKNLTATKSGTTPLATITTITTNALGKTVVANGARTTAVRKTQNNATPPPPNDDSANTTAKMGSEAWNAKRAAKSDTPLGSNALEKADANGVEYGVPSSGVSANASKSTTPFYGMDRTTSAGCTQGSDGSRPPLLPVLLLLRRQQQSPSLLVLPLLVSLLLLLFLLSLPLSLLHLLVMFPGKGI